MAWALGQAAAHFSFRCRVFIWRSCTVLAFADMDSMQKRVYGNAKDGAGFGYMKIQGKSLMIRGLNALAAVASTPLAAPLIAAGRLRGGTANSARGGWFARYALSPVVIVAGDSRVSIDCLAEQEENLDVWCGIRAGEGRMSEQAGDGVPRGSETESSPQLKAARDASDVAEGSAPRGVYTDTPVDTEPEIVLAAEGAAKDPDGSKWIRGSFARQGLAFMLDHPAVAIRNEIYKIISVLFGTLFVLVIIFLFLFQAVGSAVADLFAFHMNKFHISIIEYAFFICLCVALSLVVAYALAVIVPAVRPTLREWSRVDNRMALMLSFVALFFLSEDSWRLTGSIPWWRLRTFVVVFALVYICVLYRQAKRVIDGVLEQPIEIDDVPNSIREKYPLIKQTLINIDSKRPPKRALVNLRMVAVALLARRIIISAIIVSAILFAFGIILLSRQDTLGLMDSPSPAVIGYTATFGFRNYQFFLSESLLKVSLSLGTIAAAYFVFANPDPALDPDRDRDTLVTTFIRKTIALWACYQHLAGAAQSARPTAEETERADAAEARVALPD